MWKYHLFIVYEHTLYAETDELASYWFFLLILRSTILIWVFNPYVKALREDIFKKTSNFWIPSFFLGLYSLGATVFVNKCRNRILGFLQWCPLCHSILKLHTHLCNYLLLFIYPLTFKILSSIFKITGLMD